jgi:hypothetical protein
MQLLNDEEVPSVSPQCLLRALVLLQRQLTSISSQRDARELLPDTVLKRWNIDSLLPV